ncbi:MAG: hypothetical protein AAFW89_01210 [Bacteroidota bacterium]
MDSKKFIVLSPHWKAFATAYIAGICLLPLAGIGLLILFSTWKRQTALSFEIHDTFILFKEEHYEQRVELHTIQNVELIEGAFGTQTLRFTGSFLPIEFSGLTEAVHIKHSIEQAIAHQKSLLEQQLRVKPRETEFKPGSMDRIDYLTGLWQQGLISDEDYDLERKRL